MIEKRREPCVLFLEDVFSGNDHPQALRDAGFLVEVFGDHFKDKQGKKEEHVKDPRIIRFCATNKWVLITPDKQLLYTHNTTIRQTDVAIIATAHNRGKIKEWIEALIKGKTKIERHCRKVPRPSFATIDRAGNLTNKEIGRRGQRRHRPREGQEK